MNKYAHGPCYLSPWVITACPSVLPSAHDPVLPCIMMRRLLDDHHSMPVRPSTKLRILMAAQASNSGRSQSFVRDR